MANNHFDFYTFKGFTYPTTTPVPDLIFDHVMQELNEGELKVLLYIIRRTFGFKKQSDDISLAQMVEGIVTKEGNILDRGTGLSKKTVLAALRSLKDKNLIETKRNRDNRKGNLPTSYRLKMHTPLGEESTPRGGEDFTPRARGKIFPKQQTVLQQTAKQHQSPKNVDPNNHNSGDGRKQKVVVALTEVGITKKVAQRLASRHNEVAIYQQLDYHAYELATIPQKITSPSGRLRTRIEEIWPPPDGYSPNWQERLATEKTRIEQAHQEQEALKASVMAQGDMKQKEQEQSRQQHLATLKRQYNTSETEEKIWSEIKSEVLDRVGEVEYKTLIAGSELLATDNHQATIWVRHSFLAKAIEKRYGVMLKQLLANHLHISPDDLAVAWIHSPSNKTDATSDSR